jgi:lysophospholipase L1-like esterase
MLRRRRRAIIGAAILVAIGAATLWALRRPPAQPERHQLVDVNADGKVVVLCFGDSVTLGGARGAYPAWLRSYFVPSVQVINQGKYGEWTADGVKRLAPLLEQLHPDYVIILEGVNDAVREGCANIAATENNFKQMIDQIRGVGAIPFVGTIFAAPSYVGDAGERCIDRINQMIRELPVEQIDFAVRIRGHAELMLDGLHPNNRGYELLARQALEALLRPRNGGGRPLGRGLGPTEHAAYWTGGSCPSRVSISRSATYRPASRSGRPCS